MGDFGEKFRKARESKNISLEDASNVTKIGLRMLRAIEEERFDRLPGGVFNKGFIRAYAKTLGINDEEAITEYLECLRQEQIKQQAAAMEAQAQPQEPQKHAALSVDFNSPNPEHPAPTDEGPHRQLPRAEDVRPPRHNYLDRRESGIPVRLLVVAGVVIVLAILWQRHPGPRADNATARASVPAATTPASSAPAAGTPAQSQTPPAATIPAAPTRTTPNATTPRSQPEPTSAVAPSIPQQPSVAPITSAPAPQPERKPSIASQQPSSSPSLAAGSGDWPIPAVRAGDSGATAASAVKPAADRGKNEITARPGWAVEAAPAVEADVPLTLVIRASQNSWISVFADGQPVSQETLIAPARTSIRAHRQIVAKVGNAAGVTFLWNGKEIPPQGEKAEMKTFVFDAQGMRVIASSLAPPQNP